MKHKHVLIQVEWDGDPYAAPKDLKMLLDCETCGERIVRPCNENEVEFCKMELEGNETHRVWFDFRAKFWPFDNNEKWTQTGYNLMEAVREWAESYPDDVRVVLCDDDAHATSLLVLIEHCCRVPGREHYMGTSVVFIPQCVTNLTPAVFFLYGRDREGLIHTLQAIRRKATWLERKEKRREGDANG